MEDFDWPNVMAALQFLLEKSQEEEPHAEVYHNNLENVIAAMPDEAFA